MATMAANDVEMILRYLRGAGVDRYAGVMRGREVRTMKRLLTTTAAVLVLAGAAHAEPLYGSGSVKRVLQYEGHSGPLVILSDMRGTAGSCPRNDYYLLHMNSVYFKQNYALILGAALSGKPIAIIVERGDCVEGLPRLKHVYMDN